jgi:magnesium-dependent phosphatase-1
LIGEKIDKIAPHIFIHRFLTMSDIISLKDFKFKPRMVVFDCDWTLYPYDCDKDRIAPFEKTATGICDRYGVNSNPYTHVSNIVGAFVDAGVDVAFLSRNPSSSSIENLLKTIPLNSASKWRTSLWDAMPSRNYFHVYSSEGYGRGKDLHFKHLFHLSNISPQATLFFDDLDDNIIAAEAMGIISVNVKNTGLDWNAVEVGFDLWQDKASQYYEQCSFCKLPMYQCRDQGDHSFDMRC